MVKVKQTNSAGSWFFLAMFLIFMTLKLTGHITWSWWIVSLPLYGPLLVVIGFMFGVLIVASLLELLGRSKKTKFGVNKNK
jgi:nitrate reductase gamma subunit